MATPGEKLAESLQALKEWQDKDNSLVIYGTTQLSRTHRDRLKLNGWLQEVLKGWYIVSKPGEEGYTTVWYSSFWNFIKAYCNRKYGNQWVLSPDNVRITLPVLFKLLANEPSAIVRAALETASTKGDIRPFARFVVSMIKNA